MGLLCLVVHCRMRDLLRRIKTLWASRILVRHDICDRLWNVAFIRNCFRWWESLMGRLAFACDLLDSRYFTWNLRLETPLHRCVLHRSICWILCWNDIMGFSYFYLDFKPDCNVEHDYCLCSYFRLFSCLLWATHPYWRHCLHWSLPHGKIDRFGRARIPNWRCLGWQH